MSARVSLTLFVLGCAGLAILAALHRAPRQQSEHALAAQRAVERFEYAKDVLAHERDHLLGPQLLAELRETDPEKTGLVGIEWSPITSTPGNLDAKRLSTDARWPPLFVRWYAEAGLQPGDRIGIAASGSFPALFLAARLAAEEMQLRPVIVVSLTSSNYGANIPEFDLLAMEQFLVAYRIVNVPIAYVSPGAGNDRGEGLEPDARTALIERVAHAPQIPGWNILPLMPVDLDDSIRRRADIFFPGSEPVRLLVNVGGQAANYGIGEDALAIPPGLTLGPEGQRLAAPDGTIAGPSVVHHAMERGIPVLHILAVRRLMESQMAGVGDADLLATRAPAVRFGAILAAVALLGLLRTLVPRPRLPQAYQPPKEFTP